MQTEQNQRKPQSCHILMRKFPTSKNRKCTSILNILFKTTIRVFKLCCIEQSKQVCFDRSLKRCLNGRVTCTASISHYKTVERANKPQTSYKTKKKKKKVYVFNKISLISSVCKVLHPKLYSDLFHRCKMLRRIAAALCLIGVLVISANADTDAEPTGYLAGAL